MFVFMLHRRDAAVDGKVGKGVLTFTIPEDQVAKVKEQLDVAAVYREEVVGSISETIYRPVFLRFVDAHAHTHYIALDVIRDVEIHEQL